MTALTSGGMWHLAASGGPQADLTQSSSSSISCDTYAFVGGVASIPRAADRELQAWLQFTNLSANGHPFGYAQYVEEYKFVGGGQTIVRCGQEHLGILSKQHGPYLEVPIPINFVRGILNIEVHLKLKLIDRSSEIVPLLEFYLPKSLASLVISFDYMREPDPPVLVVEGELLDSASRGHEIAKWTTERDFLIQTYQEDRRIFEKTILPQPVKLQFHLHTLQIAVVAYKPCGTPFGPGDQHPFDALVLQSYGFDVADSKAEYWYVLDKLRNGTPIPSDFYYYTCTFQKPVGFRESCVPLDGPIHQTTVNLSRIEDFQITLTWNRNVPAMSTAKIFTVNRNVLVALNDRVALRFGHSGE